MGVGDGGRKEESQEQNLGRRRNKLGKPHKRDFRLGARIILESFLHLAINAGIYFILRPMFKSFAFK